MTDLFSLKNKIKIKNLEFCLLQIPLGIVRVNTMFKLESYFLDRSIIEPAQSKTYNKTSVTRKDSNQPVHSHSMARVLVHPPLDSLEAVESTCNQGRL